MPSRNCQSSNGRNIVKSEREREREREKEREREREKKERMEKGIRVNYTCPVS